MANYTLVPREEESEPENEKKSSAVAAESKSSAAVETNAESKSAAAVETKAETKPSASAAPALPVPIGWTVDGVPVVDPKVGRYQWGSSIFSCAGERDGFHSSNVEVCILGTVAPCVLHGGNVERLSATPNSFENHCLPYACLYVLGNCFFGWNCLAPWYAYPNRTAIRRKFNLEGNCETVARAVGCTKILMSEAQREKLELAGDLATHVFCHPCALCQEAREVRRRIPHPGFTANPVVVMHPPYPQTMVRQP